MTDLELEVLKSNLIELGLLLIISLPIALLFGWLFVKSADWYYDKYGMP